MRVLAYILDRCSVGSEITVDGKLVHMLLNKLTAPPAAYSPRMGTDYLNMFHCTDTSSISYLTPTDVRI